MRPIPFAWSLNLFGRKAVSKLSGPRVQSFDDGMSGGPLLDLKTGTVIGITKGKRAGPLPLGGVAIVATALRIVQPEAWAANARLQHIDRRWEFARLNSSPVSDPAKATRSFLEAIIHGIGKRPAILPPGAHMSDIHQMPSVRALLRGRDKGQDTRSHTFDEPGDGEFQFEGLFQWSPLRVRWRSIVLCGMPGLGKSWLLNAHANAIAADGLARLQNEDINAGQFRYR